MKTLKIKSIVIIITAIIFSNHLFAQDNSKLEYTDKEEYFEGQSKRALKVNFVGNFIELTKVTYEHIVKPGRSLEVKGTLIDMGSDGGFGSIGYKFYKKPSFIAPGMQRRHILEGTYFKPEIFIGKSQRLLLFDSAEESEMSAGIILNIGKQWVLGKHFVIDTYFGVGAGGGNSFRGYFVGDGLALTSGLNFGFAF